MIGLVATVMVVVPTLGPLIGGVLDTALRLGIDLPVHGRSPAPWSWSGPRLALPETRGLNAPPDAREGFLARFQAALGRSARFAGYGWAATFGSATFFAFLGGGPHVIITLMERFVGGIRRVVCGLLDRLHGRQLRRLAALDALWHRPADLVGHRLRGARGRAWRSGPGGDGLALGTGGSCSCRNRSFRSATGLLLPGAISGAVSVRPQAAGTAAGITGFTQMAIAAAVTQYAGTLMANSQLGDAAGGADGRAGGGCWWSVSGCWCCRT